MNITIKPACAADLPLINNIIERAIMTWDLPERVKRLMLPSYRYDETDLQHMQVMVALDDYQVAAVACWEDAEDKDTPPGKTAVLLHGVYVAPEYQRKHIGTKLFHVVKKMAKQHHDAIVVKAQKGSEAFYLSLGMIKLDTMNNQRELENRYWKPI